MTVARNKEPRPGRASRAAVAERTHSKRASPPRVEPPKKLSRAELHDIERRLDQRQRALTTAIAEERRRIDTEALSQLDADVGDQVDQAFVMTSVEMERGLIDRYTGELERIAAVRERLAGGVFGQCIDCGEPIGAPRLQAQPTAVRCTDCQWRHEKIVDIATGSTAS
jgi:RNA polymerase-binding transcription factor